MQLQLPPSASSSGFSSCLCTQTGVPRPEGDCQEGRAVAVPAVLAGQNPSFPPYFSDNARPILTERLACFEQNNTGFDMNQILGPGDEVNKTVSLTSMSGEAAAFLSLSSSA